jgi:hypothetical protein
MAGRFRRRRLAAVHSVERLKVKSASAGPVATIALALSAERRFSGVCDHWEATNGRAVAWMALSPAV